MSSMLNPRSILHALEPRARGTGAVESLLSYFCRLAVSHSTSTLSLSRAVAQRFEHDVETEFDWFHRQLAGMGEAALTWSSALSAMTSVKRLDLLTFLPWRDVIAQNGLRIESTGQFCPHCLAQDLASGEIPYFRLSWEAKTVTVCHIHGARLSKSCPCCGKDNVRHAASLVLPGWCTKCGAFLGGEQERAEPDSFEPEELWRARQVHELIAAQQHFQSNPVREALNHALRQIIEEMDGGQCSRFARRVGLSKSTVHYWLQGGTTPTLDASLRVAAQAGMGLTQLLTGATEHWNPPKDEQITLALFKRESGRRAPRRDIDWETVEANLQAFLILPIPISVREASRRMGLEARQLYLHSNLTTRQLGERWLDYSKRRRQVYLASVMPCLEAAGEEVLAAGKAINFREISARVPPEMLAGVQGLYGLLRNMKLQPRVHDSRQDSFG